MRGDLPSGQALGRQRQHNLIDPGQPPRPFPDDLQLERPVPIPRHLDPDLAAALGSTVLGLVPLCTFPATFPAGAFLSWPRCSVSS